MYIWAGVGEGGNICYVSILVMVYSWPGQYIASESVCRTDRELCVGANQRLGLEGM